MGSSNQMKKETIWNRNFTMVVLGPIGGILADRINKRNIMVSCFVMMFLAALFSIQIMSYLQMIVPAHLIGKVISCAICIGMCASPIGQAIYGGLFEVLQQNAFVVFYVAALLTILVSLRLKNACKKLEELLKKY